jgi:maltooligosyltrehalose trehalohydrolase
MFRLDDGELRPDPASKWQPRGVHGPSMVIDGNSYGWRDLAWEAPPFRDWVIYELHVGTFTPEGTFRSAIDKLKLLSDLGVTAVELLPVAEFPGNRNWGYDGVHLYAPSRAYGHPDDLRAFVDAAHQLGLAVILDVVYNHFGPDGNYLYAYVGNYLDETKKTPWGGAIRYGDPAFGPLRNLVVANPLYWRREFHIDGFRLDATHAIMDESSRHILAEICEAIHQAGGVVIAEDNRREPRLLRASSEGGFGFDAVWADDLHHVLRVSQTGDRRSYFAEFNGSQDELASALAHGWLRTKRAGDAHSFAPSTFVQCISNHDQVGNRPLGERLHQCIGPAAYRALSMLLCLTPGTPMLFMGQEWGTTAPFLYFTDHHPELGALVTEGRRREFAEFFPPSADAAAREIPGPQAEETFLASKLAWEEREKPGHRGLLALYTECLRIRKSTPALKPNDRTGWEVAMVAPGITAIRYRAGEDSLLLLFRDRESGPVHLREIPAVEPSRGHFWSVMLSSNEERFGENGKVAFDEATQCCNFTEPETLLLKLHEVS